ALSCLLCRSSVSLDTNCPSIPGFCFLSLRDALPICRTFTELVCTDTLGPLGLTRTGFDHTDFPDLAPGIRVDLDGGLHPAELTRSEEHTSELQSRFDLVCRLLREKKKHRE